MRFSECVKRNPANLVVIALDDPADGRHSGELLREHPEVRVMAVAPEKNHIVYTGPRSIHSNA